MTDDYYYFDAKNFTVIGSKTKKIYEIGQKLYVSVVKADLVKKQLDFKLL